MFMEILNATTLYEKLGKAGILNAPGHATFELLNVKRILNDKSAVGLIFQEWLGEWMKENGIYFHCPDNTQEFPDFYLNQSENTDLLEVKTFFHTANAGFDVANYQAYCSSLVTKPYRIDADYLIFSYDLTNGIFQIKNMWLKKIWEITGKMSEFPLSVQKKRGVIYNIRPVAWYSPTITRVFKTKSEFITALFQSYTQYEVTKEKAVEWKNSLSSELSELISIQ